MGTSTDHGVRVLHAYANMTVGRVIFPNGIERQKLIKAGLVEKVEAPSVPGLLDRVMHGRGKRRDGER